MRIGILTFHYAHNYGAMLQAYALRKVLLALGQDVKFVNYKLPYIKNRYILFPPYIYIKLSRLNRMKFFIKVMLTLHEKLTKAHRFKTFQKSFLPEYKTNLSNTDLIIVGSDQVWNPTITNGYNDAYWGYLYHGIPHITYAVSCPSKYITKEQIPLLKNFKAIGVREQMAVAKLQTLNINAILTIDPTLLLNRKTWDELLKKNSPIKKKYIFSYNLSAIKELDMLAVILEKRYNLITKSPFKKSGPIEFVNWVYYSEYTLVSSFHGVAFSIIFHKPFVFFPNYDERDERVLSLLQQLNLKHCIYNGNLNTQEIPTINWMQVDEHLEKMKNESLKFLTSSLTCAPVQ